MHDERWRRLGTTEIARPSPLERVADKIDASAGPDGCHPWNGCRNKQGYGRVRIDGTTHLTHRWIMAQRLGRALDRWEIVCHHCDNPPCCNPAHLYVGTPADNARDAIVRGRRHRDVTAEARAAIRWFHSTRHLNQREIADAFNLSTTTVNRIVNGGR